MTKKFGRTDFLYMQLTLWLLENYKHVWDDYQSNVFIEHNIQWNHYEEVNQNEL